MQGAYPLVWPEGWPRERRPLQNHHFKTGFDRARETLGDELCRLNAVSAVLSSNVALRNDGLPRANQPQPEDRGVSVWFTRTVSGCADQRIALPCDRWDRVEHNILAIAKHIEAMRGQVRWGVGSLERAFTSYMALPEKGESSMRPWRIVLGFEDTSRVLSPELIRARYRDLVRDLHPDVLNGNELPFRELTRAKEEALALFTPARRP
jgi:hypothetical protein